MPVSKQQALLYSFFVLDIFLGRLTGVNPVLFISCVVFQTFLWLNASSSRKSEFVSPFYPMQVVKRGAQVCVPASPQVMLLWDCHTEGQGHSERHLEESISTLETVLCCSSLCCMRIVLPELIFEAQ